MSAINSESKKLKKSWWVKRAVQILFFLFVFFMVLTHYLEDKGIELPFDYPDLHAVCPFGAVETAGRLILQDKFIPKTHESNLWVFLGSIGATILFGALFCGWLCPLGSVQDWIGRFGKKVLGKKYNRVPVKLDKLLGYLRYPVLGMIVVQTTKLVSLAFTKFDPYYALFHFWTGEALPSAIVVLLIVIAASFFVERPWCRWLCPFGAVQGLIQLISPWKIRRDKTICIDCGKCTKACPMKIDVAVKSAVFDTRCNKCGECLSSCPVDGALDHKLPGKKGYSIKNRILSGVLVVVFFAAPIVLAEEAGLFKTTNRVEIKYGTLKAADIKASFTLRELADGFGTTVDELMEYLKLPAEISGDTKLKDIEDIDETITTRIIRDKMENFRYTD